MKKNLLIASVVLLTMSMFIGCSNDSNDSNDDANNSSKSSLSFTLNNAQYEHDSAISEMYWEKSTTTTTSVNEFKIVTSPKIKGVPCDFLEILVLRIRTTDNVLVANKTYDLYTDNIAAYLPLNDPALCYKEVNLWSKSGTSGKVKITSFDGTILKGEFSISNLTNDNGLPLGYCNGTKIVEKIFNITNGTFTAIP
ncbi:hypothetical protein QLS31_11425 [Flavobacterium sp. XS2P24]|uniref:hypothetical protein n=1 Tax=Flavobacterium sp. XS2P24 TaxID=3041249 RepID=UPI0024A9783A|nr:hypothetical protein [Flavobacterium sp. XS2P24]MDI6050443.1 hypothetical protein [Flavobacterium sp. XS2P24]